MVLTKRIVNLSEGPNELVTFTVHFCLSLSLTLPEAKCEVCGAGLREGEKY
jgi:hypothetical protein